MQNVDFVDDLFSLPWRSLHGLEHIFVTIHSYGLVLVFVRQGKLDCQGFYLINLILNCCYNRQQLRHFLVQTAEIYSNKHPLRHYLMKTKRGGFFEYFPLELQCFHLLVKYARLLFQHCLNNHNYEDFQLNLRNLRCSSDYSGCFPCSRKHANLSLSNFPDWFPSHQ